MTLLQRWRLHFAEADRCPWPGPRPLGSHDSIRMLAGREADIARLLNDCMTRNLVVLAGASGVGKSSFLSHGLRPSLEDEGYRMIVCDDWSDAPAASGKMGDTERYMRTKLKGQLLGEVDRTARLADQLEAAFGGAGLLVLDQFEEVARHHRSFFEDLIAWLVDLNRTTEARVLLSLRADAEYELRPLERGVRQFSMTTYVLDAIRDPDLIEKVVRTGNPDVPDDDHPSAIEDDAVALLRQAWVDWGGATPGARIRLLDLQAVLYVLHANARKNRRPAVSAADVMQLAERGPNPFERALQEAVELKIRRCSKAASHPEIAGAVDQALIDGAIAAIARAVGHLSSEGFKVEQEAWELATYALERELSVLDRHARHADPGPQPRQVGERAFRHLLELSRPPRDPEASDILDVPAAALAEQAGVAPLSGGRRARDVDVRPWSTDVGGLSSGPLLGFPAPWVALEEARRFAVALEWLRASSLVRFKSSERGGTIVSLIHDGFGPALKQWARDHHAEAQPNEWLHLVTAAYGEQFDWRKTDGTPWKAFHGAPGRPRFVINQRWRDCTVTARYQQVVFVNCDFRGSRFEECEFEGVTFVNCLLDNAVFGECTITGSTGEPTGEYIPGKDKGHLPAFVVRVDDALADMHRRYRVLPETQSRELLSMTSGLPAFRRDAVVEPLPSAVGITPWDAPAGGLTFYGGRLSSLMIRGCRFGGDSSLSLRHIAGSSLDIVEQVQGRFQIFDCAIRGLSVTRPVESAPCSDQGSDEITLRIESSKVANVWIGDGVVGAGQVTNSLVLQLLNASMAFLFDAQEVGYAGLVNVAPGFSGNALPGIDETAFTDRATAEILRYRMDYRSVPGRAELDAWLDEEA